MTEPPPSREVLVFNAALQLPPNERAGYSSENCCEDARLQRRVAALLEAHERAGAFLQEPLERLCETSTALSPGESNIAKVFDAGATEAGRPYFVMELVRGVKSPISAMRTKFPPKNGSSCSFRFATPFQHAHQKDTKTNETALLAEQLRNLPSLNPIACSSEMPIH